MVLLQIINALKHFLFGVFLLHYTQLPHSNGQLLFETLDGNFFSSNLIIGNFTLANISAPHHPELLVQIEINSCNGIMTCISSIAMKYNYSMPLMIQIKTNHYGQNELEVSRNGHSVQSDIFDSEYDGLIHHNTAQFSLYYSHYQLLVKNEENSLRLKLAVHPKIEEHTEGLIVDSDDGCELKKDWNGNQLTFYNNSLVNSSFSLFSRMLCKSEMIFKQWQLNDFFMSHESHVSGHVIYNQNISMNSLSCIQNLTQNAIAFFRQLCVVAAILHYSKPVQIQDPILRKPCMSGFYLSNGSCKDINECQGICATGNANCTNTCGSYNCECLPTYVDRTYLENVDKESLTNRCEELEKANETYFIGANFIFIKISFPKLRGTNDSRKNISLMVHQHNRLNLWNKIGNELNIYLTDLESDTLYTGILSYQMWNANRKLNISGRTKKVSEENVLDLSATMQTTTSITIQIFKKFKMAENKATIILRNATAPNITVDRGVGYLKAYTNAHPLQIKFTQLLPATDYVVFAAIQLTNGSIFTTSNHILSTSPDPPQEVSAAVKDFSVVLKWKTPNSKNITSYRVTFYWNRNNMFTRFIRCQRHQNDKCTANISTSNFNYTEYFISMVSLYKNLSSIPFNTTVNLTAPATNPSQDFSTSRNQLHTIYISSRKMSKTYAATIATATATATAVTPIKCSNRTCFVNGTRLETNNLVINSTLKFNYSNELDDPTSELAENYTRLFRKVMEEILTKENYHLINLKNISFRPGSIIIHADLLLASTVQSTYVSITHLNANIQSQITLYESQGFIGISLDVAEDVCKTQNIHCKEANASCQSTVSSAGYHCLCNRGFREKNKTHRGTSCEPACSYDGGEYCENNGICQIEIYTEEAARCTCSLWYKGIRCTEFNIALAIIVGVIVGGSSVLLLGIAVTLYKKKMAKKTLLEYDYQMQEHTYENHSELNDKDLYDEIKPQESAREKDDFSMSDDL